MSAKFRAKLYGSLGVLLPMAGTTFVKVRTVYYCVLSCLLERVTTILMFTTKKCVLCFYARVAYIPLSTLPLWPLYCLVDLFLFVSFVSTFRPHVVDLFPWIFSPSGLSFPWKNVSWTLSLKSLYDVIRVGLHNTYRL